ncbi:hypothetical protein ACJX0J_031579, partial [Zea mays]
LFLFVQIIQHEKVDDLHFKHMIRWTQYRYCTALPCLFRVIIKKLSKFPLKHPVGFLLKNSFKNKLTGDKYSRTKRVYIHLVPPLLVTMAGMMVRDATLWTNTTYHTINILMILSIIMIEILWNIMKEFDLLLRRAKQNKNHVPFSRVSYGTC